MQERNLRRFRCSPRHTGPQHKSEHQPARHPVAPNSPPRALSAPETRRGRPTTNSTPRTLRTHSSTKLSEQRAGLEPEILRELEGMVFEVRTDAFIRAFQYMGDKSRMRRDKEHAAACLSTLQVHNPVLVQDDGLNADLDQAPKYNNGFRKLNNLSSEVHGYEIYANLLNYAGAFFRHAIEGSNAKWSPAQEPGRDDTTPTKGANTHLLRMFRNTHDRPRAFSRLTEHRAALKPDLCLLIEAKDPPADVQPHWKDVLLPIEVKTENQELAAVVQCARYARAMMQEQFDRNFGFSVILFGNKCRVFYWNVVAAHVTEPIDIHQEPETFLQVMGRFATMTPAELGYDTHFSNAGRVLSFQTKNIKTHLALHPSETRTWLEWSSAPPPTPECPAASDTSPRVLEIESTLFEANGLLFNRATRVWKGVAFNGNSPSWTKGKTYIIKQNWADDSRPNEGSFHKTSTTIPAVPRLVCLEECSTTFSYHAQITKNEVIGILGVVQSEHSDNLAIGTYSAGGLVSRNEDVDDEDASAEDSSAGDSSAEDSSAEDSSAEGSQLASVRGDDNTGNGMNESGKDPSIKDANIKANHEKRDGDEKKTESRYYLERILLRFVFDHAGQSLGDAKSAVELLEANIQWIEGLCAMNRAGIIHRDISYGNLMLPNPDDQPKQASIIDFGLAHWTDETTEGQDETTEGQGETTQGQGETTQGQGETIVGQQDDMPSGDRNRGPRWSSQPHCHVTGTLPFVASELLRKHIVKQEEHKHALHHDVESIFWVLLYICLEKGDYVHELLSGVYNRLNSRDPQVVMDTKISFLFTHYPLLDRVVGDFGGLKYFLMKFAEHYKSRQAADQPIDVEQVLIMAKQGLTDAIENEAKLKQEAAELKLKEASKKAKTAPKAKTHKAKASKISTKPNRTKRKSDSLQLPTIDEDQQGDTDQNHPPKRKKAKRETRAAPLAVSNDT